MAARMRVLLLLALATALVGFGPPHAGAVAGYSAVMVTSDYGVVANPFFGLPDISIDSNDGVALGFGEGVSSASSDAVVAEGYGRWSLAFDTQVSALPEPGIYHISGTFDDATDAAPVFDVCAQSFPPVSGVTRGTLIIDEATYDMDAEPADRVLTFEARFQMSCSTNGLRSFGHVVHNVDTTVPGHYNQGAGRASTVRTPVDIDVQIANSGSAPLVIDRVSIGLGPANFSVVGTTCATVAPDETCTVTVRANSNVAGTFRGTVEVSSNLTDSVSDGGGVWIPVDAIFTAPPPTTPPPTLPPPASSAITGGEVVPITPARILDTREGNGRQGTRPVSPNSFIDLQVTGRGGVPAGVDAVFLNVTVTGPTAPGHLTVYPCCGATPLASNLNFVVGDTVPNLVLTQLSPDGRARFWINGAAAHIVADVAAYVTGWDSGATGDRMVPITPSRLFDSRNGAGTERRPFGEGESRSFSLPTTLVPANASGVVLNLTGTEGTAPTHLTVWPGGAGMPVVSNLNLRAGETRPNLVVAALGPDRTFNVFNNAGSTHILADVVGYVAPASDGPAGPNGRLLVIPPERIFDTRLDFDRTPLAPGDWISTDETELEAILGVQVAGFVDNVTITEPTAPTFVSVVPGAAPSGVPGTSNLNAVRGQTIPNLVLSQLDAQNRQFFYNNAGFTHLIDDSVAIVLGPDLAVRASADADPSGADRGTAWRDLVVEAVSRGFDR